MKNLLSKAAKWIVSVLMVLVMFPTAVTTVKAEEQSANLNDFVKNVTIAGVNENNGSYTVFPDQEYSIDLQFGENSNKQFANKMTYIFPTGFNVADGVNGTLDISVKDGGQTYVISDNTYSVKGNVLTFVFNTKDSNWTHLNNASNAKFLISIKGSFSGNGGELIWGGDVKTNVIIQNDHHVNVDKSCSRIDQDQHKAYWKITVESTGNNSNIVITDSVTGTALTLDTDTIQDSNNMGKATSITNNGFIYTIPSMGDRAKTEITYSTSIDYSKLSGRGTAEQTSNSITFNGNTKSTDLNNQIQIDFHGIVKSHSDAVDGTVAGHKSVAWTVTYNDKMLASAAGITLTDTIDDNSKSIMTYTGNATVKVINKNDETVDTRTIENISGSSFKYEVPTTDTGIYKYVITYNTDVDMTKMVSKVDVKNHVNDGSTYTESSAPIYPDEGNEISVSKTATAVSQKEITWQITLYIPASGLDNAHVEDTFPATWFNNSNYNDTLAEEPTVKGLDANEAYTAKDNGNNVEFDFFKDKDKKINGLNSSDSSRQIVITLTTNNQKDWVRYAASNQDYAEHINNVSFKGNGSTVYARASAHLSVVSIVKKSTNQNDCSGKTESGLPYYEFTIDLCDLKDGGTQVTDEFDTDYFTIADKSVKFESWNRYWGSYKGTKATVTNTGTGATFSWTKDDQNVDSYRGRITYRLQVKDAAALEKLKNAAAQKSDGIFPVTNTATYGTVKSTASSKYTYEGLTKDIDESQLKPSDGSTPIAHYTLTVNPGALDMSPDSDTLVVTDDFHENQSIVYTSIKILDENGNKILDANGKVASKYDVNGSVATFTVPDNKKVIITYDCSIIGTGDNVEIKNDASIYGYKAHTDKTAKGTTAGQGTASVYSVKVLKYEKGNLEKTLAGAVYGLFYEDGTAVDDGTGNQVKIETTKYEEGKQELAVLVGSKDENGNGWGLYDDRTYYLQEITAPTGYKLDTKEYKFKVGDSTDYTGSIPVFSSSDNTLKMADIPLVSSTVNKIWDDKDNQDKIRPESLTVTLTGKSTKKGSTDATIVSQKDYTLEANEEDPSKNWTLTVDDLDGVDDDGNTITYTWSEGTVEGYKSSGDPKIITEGTSTKTVLTNTHTPETTSVTAKKAWSDNNNQDGVRPEEVSVNLYKTVDGTKTAVEGKTATLNDANSWAYTFEDLPVNENGKQITYSVEETSVKDYVATYAASEDGTITVTNTHTPGETSVSVTKAWVDENNTNSTRPDSIEVQLYVDGEVSGDPVELTAQNAWSYTWSKIDQKHNGKDIVYTVKEVNVPEGYVTGDVTGSQSAGYVITNTRMTGNLVIKKSFDGDNITDTDKANLNFEVKGPNYDEVFNYGTAFTDGILTLKNLTAGEYTVTERNPEIAGYDVTVTATVNNDRDGSTATVAANTTQQIDIRDSYAKLGNLVIKKTFDGDNITDEDKANLKFEIVKPDGTKETVGLNKFTKDETGAYTYTMNQVADGKYTVHETNPEIKGYDVTVTTTVDGKTSDTAAVATKTTSTIEVKDSYTKRPTTPITPDTPTPTPSAPTTPETPERPTTPTTTDRPHTPNTGDQTNAGIAAGAFGFSMLIAGLAIFFKKKYSA